jgi:hypothetical protein
MSIADAGSVLILGAGVSEPFGIPLGGQLIDEIAHQIAKESPGPRKGDPQLQINWAYHANDWYQFPIYGTVLRSKSNGIGLTPAQAAEAHSELQNLRTLLVDQTAETIDAFISENPAVAPIAKAALAAVMLQRTYVPIADQPVLGLRPISTRTLACPHRRDGLPKEERNWIHLLINIVREGVDTGKVNPKQKVRIITFNYDTILEYVLEKQFQNRQSQLGPYQQYIDILHAHGQFTPLSETCTDPAMTALAWANGICVVKDHVPSETIVQARTNAKGHLSDARQIYAIGFSFAYPNCELIGLSEPGRGVGAEGRHLFYCNYAGNAGIEQRAARNVRSFTRHSESGTWEHPLSISEYVSAGHLGDLPG